jgi:protein TonB
VFFESGLSPDAREPDAPEPAVPPGDLAGTAAATAGYVQAAVLPATPPAAGYAQAESAGEEPAGFSGAVQPGPEPAGLDRDQLKALIKGLIEERLSYPAAARRRNIEGVVDISLRIDVSGKLLECGVRRGSGSPVLDRAARDLAGGIFPLKGIRLSAPAELVISISYALR